MAWKVKNWTLCQELSGLQCCVSWCLVMMETPNSCGPNFWLFPSYCILHVPYMFLIISLIKHLDQWNKITMNNGCDDNKNKYKNYFPFQVHVSCFFCRAQQIRTLL
jgi:hypothetical protein